MEQQRQKKERLGGFSHFCASDIRLSLALNIFIPFSDASLIPPRSGIIDLAWICSVSPLSWQAKGSTECTEVVCFVT